MPPVFRLRITPLEINVGSSAKFECEITEAPDVTFRWYKSGTEIKQSEKYRILSSSAASALELLNPVKSDSGEYTCKASNQHGVDSCAASLVVTGKTPCLQFFTERERENYILTCTFFIVYDGNMGAGIEGCTGYICYNFCFLNVYQLVYCLLRDVPTNICIKTRANDSICGQRGCFSVLAHWILPNGCCLAQGQHSNLF